MKKVFGIEFYPVKGTEIDASSSTLYIAGLMSSGVFNYVILTADNIFYFFDDSWHLMGHETTITMQLALFTCKDLSEIYCNQDAADWDLPKEIIDILCAKN